MALNENAIFTAAKGYVYVADVDGAAKPTPSQISQFSESTGLGQGWRDLGHTSRDELPEFGFDGGETETRGTWRAAALKTVIPEAAVDYVVIQLHQFDDEGLSLYYGVENVSDVPGEFAVSGNGTPQERALCIVIEDGDNRIALYAPKVSIIREDSITMAVDEFAALPIRCTFLKKDGEESIFTWINEEVLNAGASS